MQEGLVGILLHRQQVGHAQHAVALAFVVPLDGDCAPSQDALDLVWVTPEVATSAEFEAEMSGGQGRLVRMALAHCGLLP